MPSSTGRVKRRQLPIRNTTKEPHIPDHAIRRAISWACRQLGMPESKLSSVTVVNRSDGMTSGRCWLGHGRIHLSIGYVLCDDPVQLYRYEQEGVPTHKHAAAWGRDDRTRRVGGEYGVRRRLDRAMNVIFHEVAHRYLYLEGKGTTRTGRHGGSERSTEWHERELMRAYEARREVTLDQFLAPPRQAAVAARAGIDPRVKRARRDAELLKQWQRKAALAKTKLAQYRQRVARHRRAGLLDDTETGAGA